MNTGLITSCLVALSWLSLAPTASAQAVRSRVAPEAVPSEAALSEAVLSEDIPEEILRTEIITGARSPLTGEPVSAAEYAVLQAELAASAGDPLVNQQLRYLIFLLQIRRGVQPIIPFL
ncbi:MAG: hypothetical protein AAFV85_13375 [Cyanobacteria bacterium J06634_6]